MSNHNHISGSRDSFPPNAVQRPAIVLTPVDRDAVLKLLRELSEPATFLREELERADIASGDISPNALVSIGSTVKFIDHSTMNIKIAKLVLPCDANGTDLISITGALGSALIGLGPGQTITWYEDQIERRTTVLETNRTP
jgi:regulator of nucleoside diphosphate kinase